MYSLKPFMITFILAMTLKIIKEPIKTFIHLGRLLLECRTLDFTRNVDLLPKMPKDRPG